MSTRCNIHFVEGKRLDANIYRHCDGYPDTNTGVLADLQSFFKQVKKECTKDMYGTRFDDASYFAAKFVVWQAGQNARGGSLAFGSLGIVSQDAGDGEYIYTVDCGKLDHNGFPTVTYKEA